MIILEKVIELEEVFIMAKKLILELEKKTLLEADYQNNMIKCIELEVLNWSI